MPCTPGRCSAGGLHLDRLDRVFGVVFYRVPECDEPGPVAFPTVGRVEFIDVGEHGPDDRARHRGVGVTAVPLAADGAGRERVNQRMQGCGGRPEHAVAEGKRVRAVDFLYVHVNCGHGSLRSIAGFECPGTDVDRTLDAELVTDDLSASRSTRAPRQRRCSMTFLQLRTVIQARSLHLTAPASRSPLPI